jgi:predicted lactoylglutathione lyase
MKDAASMQGQGTKGGSNVATTQEALQITTIMPNLTVDDLKKSISFYEALGFTAGERWEDNGALIGIMMSAGKTQFGLSQDDWKKGRDRKKGVGMRLYMTTTQNVDEIARRAKSAGIALKAEPHDSEWKSREFEVVDPSGFLLTISSEIPA